MAFVDISEQQKRREALQFQQGSFASSLGAALGSGIGAGLEQKSRDAREDRRLNKKAKAAAEKERVRLSERGEDIDFKERKLIADTGGREERIRIQAERAERDQFKTASQLVSSGVTPEDAIRMIGLDVDPRKFSGATPGRKEQVKSDAKIKREATKQILSLNKSIKLNEAILEEAEAIERSGVKLGPITGLLEKGKRAVGLGDPKVTKFFTKTGLQLANSIKAFSGAAASDKERAFLQSLQPDPQVDGIVQIKAKVEAMNEYARTKAEAINEGLSNELAGERSLETAKEVLKLSPNGAAQPSVSQSIEDKRARAREILSRGQ